MIRKAQDLVEKGGKALVVFTRGDHFVRGENGDGHTGYWHADEKRLKLLDKIIVYHHDERSGVDTVFMGSYAGFQQSPEPRRKTIFFSGLKDCGVTSSNWVDFGGRPRTAFFYYPEAGSW